MDPLSILATVVSTAISIYNWVDQLEATSDTIRDLHGTLSSITIVLKPLQTRVSDGSLSNDPGILICVQDIGETLGRAQEHLLLWQESETRKKGKLGKRILAFLDPSSVLDELREDRTRLDQKIGVLALAVQLSSLSGSSSISSVPDPLHSPADQSTNAEVREFWRQMIGTVGKQAFCCPTQKFCDALSLWLDQPLAGMAEVLMNRLDEVGFGGITPSSFNRFVGTRSIREAVDQLRVPPAVYSVVQKSDVKRLMLWIDLGNQEISMRYAESFGITVVAFTSTATAKAWMEVNDATLRRTAAAHRLRFVADNALGESAAGGPTPAAGESFLRSTINTTTYVSHYSRAGSTSDIRVLHGYIDGLAKGIRDVEWVGYHVVWGIGPKSLPASMDDSLFVRPTLVFVTGGSSPQANEAMINYSMNLGIVVVVLSTTAELKSWAESNEVQLYAMAAAHRLRFITQNVRWEFGILNANAGADTLHYIRSELGLVSPVLIYGNSSIATTIFVTQYARAGSTSDERVVRGFVESLALGVRDDDWVGFNVGKDRGPWNG